MPDDRRPRSVRLNAAPHTKPPPRGRSPRRPRKPRRTDDSAMLPYWIAVLLVVVLLAIVAAYIEAPEIKAWFAGAEPPAGKFPLEPLPGPASAKPPPAATPSTPPQPTAEEERMRKLKEEAAGETRKLEERTMLFLGHFMGIGIR